MNDTAFPSAISYVQKNGIWFILGIFVVIFLALVISDEKWIYLSVLSAPVLIYYSIKKPFIFPLGLYAFLLPFEGVLDSSSGINVTKMLAAMTILVLSVKGTFENKLKKPNTAVIWWTLFVLYCSLSIVWAMEPGIVFRKLVTAVSLLLLYLITVSYKVQKREYDALKWSIFAGGFVAALILIHNYVTGNFANAYHMKTSLQFDGEGIDPDVQAFYLLLPVSVGILLMLEQKKKTSQGLLLIATFSIIMGVITTGTRGALMAICVIFIVYMKFIKKKISFGIMVLIAAFILILLIPEHVIEHVESSASDQGAGRVDIWMVGLKSLQNNWMTGAGFNNFPNAYDKFVDYWPYFHGLHRAPHNIFLGVLVELGVLGFILLTFSLMRHYQYISAQYIQDSKDQIMLKAAFWGILTHSFFIDTLWLKSFWLLWMMIIIYRNAFGGMHGNNASL